LERKAARRRTLTACAASIAIHAAFFTLLFAFSPSAPSSSPKLEVIVQGAGEESDATGGAIAGARAPAPYKAAAIEAAGAKPGAPAAADPAAPAQAKDALSDAAEAGTATRDQGPGASTGSAANPDSSVATAGPAGVSGAGATPSGGDMVAGDPVAALAARINAAVEARKAYPEAARRRGTEGSVRLALLVAEDGRLLVAKLAASSGSTVLDRAALDLAASVFPVNNIAGQQLELVLTISYTLIR
jgi:periplasmic protein TonB